MATAMMVPFSHLLQVYVTTCLKFNIDTRHNRLISHQYYIQLVTKFGEDRMKFRDRPTDRPTGVGTRDGLVVLSKNITEKFHQNWTINARTDARRHGRTHAWRTQDHDISPAGLWPLELKIH
ncbi:hypothetical protein DPMN_036405 [Dreissena polymorpha]|uniref:Uncharacterized protein n=1 Tax=Dreissena polymorpha TaxID=45954 RepID=A0A9D4RN19_DREPO|nr:hypothetical protein DPMN_036405 [Dreissena polymorpha]